MDFSWITAANDLVTAAVSVGGTIFAHKKGWLGIVAHKIAQNSSRLVQDAEQVAEGFGQLVPAVSEAEQALKSEIDQLTAKARQTELYRVAATGLHAFGIALDALSDDQRKALEFDIASKVPGVTPQEVADALALVQKQADETAASPLITAANALTQAKQAQAQPAQQATA